MDLFTETSEQLAQLQTLLGDGTDTDSLPHTVSTLDDDALLSVIQSATVVIRELECVRVLATGAVAERSTRNVGHKGLAQAHGHGNTASLVQSLTGGSRADARKHVRLGAALLESAGLSRGGGIVGADASDSGWRQGAGPFGLGAGANGAGFDAAGDAGGGIGQPGPRPWHAPLADALRAGRISTAQHEAILTGLGEPPIKPFDIGGLLCVESGSGVAARDRGDRDADANDETHGDHDGEAHDGPVAHDVGHDAARVEALRAHEHRAQELRDAWRCAAEQLMTEAPERTVEELRRSARSIRDLLDAEGAAERFQQRFEQRSFRMYIDRDGVERASIAFDDEGAAWFRSVIDAALRPRRGGPRFVDAEELARAKELADDPRSNDQLAYDLLIDVLRAGTLADAENVYGTRQPGVRLVQVVDADGAPAPVAHTEDRLVAMPGWIADQKRCDTGSITCTVDRAGNPLFLGRDERLFSTKQRIALAI